MEVLLNIWYGVTSIIGFLLFFISCILGILGTILFLGCLIDSIKYKDLSDLKVAGIFMIIISIICSFTYCINITIPKDNQIVSEEIPNVQKYEGFTDEKSGKYISSYYYFEQGTNNNYKELKIDFNKTTKHYTDGQVKIVKSHIEYTSLFRGFAISANQGKEWYDIYIPNNEK